MEKEDFYVIDIENLSLFQDEDKKFASFDLKINGKKIKNEITSKSDCSLYFKNGSIYAQNLLFISKNSNLILRGKLYGSDKKYDFNLEGYNFSVDSIQKAFLTFIKQKNKKKNFIENFYDFEGVANLNLKISNSDISGKVSLRDLKAKTVRFQIPLYFKKADFYFDRDKITLKENGKFGEEKVYTEFFAEDLFKDKKIKGSVKTEITENFSKKYIPDFDIEQKALLSLVYFVHDGKTTVEYLAKLPTDTVIKYKTSNLGLKDKNRRIYAKTFKDGDNLYIKHYDYSIYDEGSTKNILSGSGLLTKKNDKMILDYIRFKTNGKAPVSIIGSLSKYVSGGVFEGDLEYKLKENALFGDFNLYNSRYKTFYIKEAKINSNDKRVFITANGTFENEPYSALLDVSGDFEKNPIINNVELYLRKYKIKPSAKRSKIKISDEIKEDIIESDWEIKKGSIKLDELRYKKVLLSNIELIGSAKNNIINFTMPKTNFAEGVLFAKGTYDLGKRNSDIYFSAENINSNIAASMIFDLVNQVQGKANASMHFLSYRGLEDIKAHINFLIENGALTKIGSTEFMVKKSKFKLSDITNIDVKKMEAIKSNIKGSFDVHNRVVKNLEIYSGHKFLSFFIEGNYNLKKQNGNINVWGAYNEDAQKGIRILYIPLSLITKIILRPAEMKAEYFSKVNKIPKIEADKDKKKIFRVKIEGNLNQNSSVKVRTERYK